MKKILLFVMGLLPSLLLSAQCMYIYQNNTAIMVNAETTGDINYSGNAITVEGTTFPLEAVDSITFAKENMRTDSVVIKYSNTSAMVYVPIKVYPYLNITANDAHVAITSSQLEGNEIVYALSGTATDGSFYQTGDYKCKIRLNGVSLTNKQGAAINIENGKRIEVTVTEGTVNTLNDCANGTQKACLRIKGHAEFKGGGTLNIAGNTGHAYDSNEYTEIKQSFGTLNITSAVKDAMHVSQYFKMNGGTINISGAAGDGIQADTTDDKTDEMNGQMIINGGTVNITLNSDDVCGLKCDSLFTCTGGTFNITVNGRNTDCVAANKAEINATTSTPVFTLYAKGGYLEVAGDKKKSACFKTDSDMYFRAGTINAYATGDKAKGIRIHGNYYHTAIAITNVAPDIDGIEYVISK